MPRFAANLSMMFTEMPFLERFQAAADAGFAAVEYLFPYDHPAEEVAAARRDAGVEQVLFNAPAGDWAAGERGLACLPDRQEEFDRGLETALRYAEALDCPRIHVMAGIPRPDGELDAAGRAAAREVHVRRVRQAADAAAAVGRRVLIEPINPVDMPGYLLDSVHEGRDVLEQIDHPAVGLQLDLYHAQITDGDLTRLIRSAADVVEHVQIASVPDRHEPDGGELDLDHVLGVLDDVGYAGWVGCEYRPAGETRAGLGWFHRRTGSGRADRRGSGA
ncbi:hydroxypyruvate isomerase family protein [Nesterenkonia halophila]|uniref:2-oxo-tetronate isomerase n=1 Tax=Nesterenkonia halophila TaxID=302044 RepID=UPI001292BC36|nr:2-oxo-tetronate isomerase [Nesterenkonia halophila]